MALESKRALFSTVPEVQCYVYDVEAKYLEGAMFGFDLFCGDIRSFRSSLAPAHERPAPNTRFPEPSTTPSSLASNLYC